MATDTDTDTIPLIEAFLKLSRDDIRSFMPATVIYTPGGTRRHAILNGINPSSDAYILWSRQRVINYADLLFSYGVKHLFTVGIWPRTFAETGPFNEGLIQKFTDKFTSDHALAHYQERGFRMRITGLDELPELAVADERLNSIVHSGQNQPTIWLSFSPHFGASWSSILRAAARSGATTRDEVVHALYGEHIPPAGLWISFGKPMASSDVAPPLMLEETQCYWTQRPGYSLNDEDIRRILYDLTYLRRTWRPDKSSRYAEVLSQRTAWERAPILGVGQRLGSYWYPQQPAEETP